MAERAFRFHDGLTRRDFCHLALTGVALGAVTAPLKAYQGVSAKPVKEGFKPEELRALESIAAQFMEKHRVPGLSVAIARHGALVYARGFGLADKQHQESVTPAHLFRIASVSKPITATTVFRLIEKKRLQLSDKVFGSNGVLGNEYTGPPYPRFVPDITVEHMLTHTAGGWPNDGSDPMFRHLSMDHHQLISWTLRSLPLKNAPGTHYAYSNFGFCVLGRVIEKITGKPYAQAVQDEVLTPCRISGMRLAGNTLSDRAPNEVVYYSQESDTEDPYAMNVRRMDAHGGWLATATDLVRFLVHVDGFPTKPDILEPEIIATMTSASAAAPDYAKGWCVNRYHNWWHAGSLPGTTTIMVRTAHEFCWAALTNTRDSHNIGGDLDQLIWEMVSKISVWPVGDLF